VTEQRDDRPLVETDWLAAHLEDPTIRIVDVRGTIRPVDAPKPWYGSKRDDYLAGHIPGAVYLDWLTDLLDPDAPIQMTVAKPDALAARLGRLGIGDQHTVITYDHNAHIAPRLWWVLNYYGHAAVKVLNGGFPKWAAEGRPVTPAVPAYPPATFTVRVRPEWRVSSKEVLEALGDPAIQLVDCRSPREYRGEVGRGNRKGRIPGALNVPANSLVEGEHKTFKDPEALRALYKTAGLSPDRRIITYCNAGVSASVGLLALRMAGFPNATNFAGSWYEWEDDLENPIQVD
jgi:thiosulfate/3-mercaptopyruvate sulfurtransferase